MEPRGPSAAPPLLAVALRLGTQAEALAALAAHVRVAREGLEPDPAVAGLLAEIAEEVAGGPIDPASDAAAPAIGVAQLLLAEARDLLADPARPPGWQHGDPAHLEAAGRTSRAIAGVIGAAGARLPGLGDALARPGARLLDVGVGAGHLAIALAQAFPTLAVVGIDIHEPALALARRNVADAGLDDRVSVRREDVRELRDDAGFDAAFLAMPFLPLDVARAALGRVRDVLRPGGHVLPGIFAGSGDRLGHLLADLRAVRAGGHPWHGDDLVGALADAGYAAPQEIERTWPAPVRLFAGRRPA